MTLTSTARKPWTVERHDQEDGSISYEVWDTNQDSYRRVASLNDGDNEEGRNAKRDAYTIAAGSELASPAVAPVAVSVKGLTLEWNRNNGAGADTPFGMYEISARHRNPSIIDLIFGGGEISEHSSEADAKAAAQSDFDARLSSIIPATKGGERKSPRDWYVWLKEQADDTGSIPSDRLAYISRALSQGIDTEVKP